MKMRDRKKKGKQNRRKLKVDNIIIVVESVCKKVCKSV